MAWTTPPTYTVGQVLTAANLNTYLRDNTAWLGIDSPHCRVFNSAAISTTTAVALQLTFDSERYDVGAMHSTSTSTGRLTVPTGGAGKYHVFGHVEFASNATGYRDLALRVNGTTQIGSQIVAGVSGVVTQLSVASMWAMAVGDFFDLVVLQTSGGNLNVNATPGNSAEFGCAWARI